MLLVLVVDDDDAVRPMVADLTEAMGHHVLVAANGADALAILEGEAIDILITDIVMPGMNGYELAERAHRLRPDMAILCMTAFPLAQGNALNCSAVLRKPFRAAQLKAALDSIATG